MKLQKFLPPLAAFVNERLAPQTVVALSFSFLKIPPEIVANIKGRFSRSTAYRTDKMAGGSEAIILSLTITVTLGFVLQVTLYVV